MYTHQHVGICIDKPTFERNSQFARRWATIKEKIMPPAGATIKGKNMLPRGSIFFPLKVAPVRVESKLKAH